MPEPPFLCPNVELKFSSTPMMKGTTVEGGLIAKNVLSGTARQSF